MVRYQVTFEIVQDILSRSLFSRFVLWSAGIRFVAFYKHKRSLSYSLSTGLIPSVAFIVISTKNYTFRNSQFDL